MYSVHGNPLDILLQDPKSASFDMFPDIKMFSGLISLWKMLFLCMWSRALKTWNMWCLTFDSGKNCFRSLIHSYILRSISSKTKPKRPLRSSLFLCYNMTSKSFTMWGWGDNRFNAWISRKLFTSSLLLNSFFMHLIATNFPVDMFWAFITSLKVPSPFFEINLYSN